MPLRTLQSVLSDRLQRAPEDRAITFIRSNGIFQWMNYAELIARARACAACFQNEGLKSRDVCLIVLPHSQTTVDSLMAALMMSAIPLLIAPPLIQGQKSSYSSLLDTLHRIIRKTRPGIVLIPGAMQEMCDTVIRTFRKTRFLIAENLSFDQTPELARIESLPSDVAAYQLSSGTTGSPKICVWKHEQLMAALDTNATGMKLHAQDVLLSWVPLYHDMGLVNNLLTCLVKSVPFAMMDPADFVRRPALWLRALFDTGSTITWSPNFGYALAASRIRDSELQGIRLDQVRGFWNAAERIHRETVYSFYNRFASYGIELKALKMNFGCTENIGGATFSDADGMFAVDQIDAKLLQEHQIARTVTDPKPDQAVITVVESGTACNGIRPFILSPKRKILKDGMIGELALETPSRMAGYLADAKATRRALFQNLVCTGDLGYLRGDRFFWVGRVKERITVRGKKLDPSDFERVLFEIDALRPGCFVVFGVDDRALGTQKVIVVSEIQDSVSLPYDSLIQTIRNSIYQSLGVTVDEVYFTAKGTLSKTSSGKRRHRHFRKLYLEGKLSHSFRKSEGN